ncbi:HNH endonuclease [Rhodococcus sp. IEGM 1318]|uniref:HNH endonuclease n=1 Tax=Rhodococcus sp. IEGM 1318 TaxID=3082226 RepID=UPI002954FE62|nr:HNH endonuclease [Rhodococcus sp. IEGM 1318]MDV8007016.1 HNH endonuclease [Rhodococcus sp. IEGM 1318]
MDNDDDNTPIPAPSQQPRADVLARVAAALSGNDISAAKRIIGQDYPFTPPVTTSRNYTPRQSLRTFIRDGFIDRYSGTRLVHPGALRVLSRTMPEVFPFHPNWLMTATHFAFWELSPTIDHLVPIARGGADDETNWATTSMLRNSAKGHWTLDELGWTITPAGDYQHWDGLTDWFIEHVNRNPELLADKYIARWHRASVDVLNSNPQPPIR